VTLKLCGKKGLFRDFFEYAQFYDIMLPCTQTQVMQIWDILVKSTRNLFPRIRPIF